MQVRAYGKINLYLDVLDRRPDGFTNIETIFQTVDLHDTLTFEKRNHELTMTCSNPSLEVDESNLVLRAARLLQEHTGCDKGVSIHLDKQIPIAGGMAGGSVDAAATLSALNQMWALELNGATLHACALTLGSDVPYCLLGGTVAATGRGEILDPLESLPETSFLIVQPELGISAGTVYGHSSLTRNMETPIRGRTPSFERVVTLLQESGAADMMFNRMESAILVMHPELAGLRNQMLDAGCAAAIVSGSGSTLVGLCHDRAEATHITNSFLEAPAMVVQSVTNSIEMD
jgi:4-diphosphocytidyl-2-C-methyl-D-erythritol kinase